MKRVLLIALLVFAVLAQAFCLEVTDGSSKRVFDANDYDSYPMLEHFYHVSDNVDSSLLDQTEVSILTVSKSDPLYSWFGHAAVLVKGVYYGDAMYDWGRFAFGRDFYINFIMGRLWYSCCSVNARLQLDEFQDNNRTVQEIKLNLTPAQKKAVFDFLETNSTEPWNKYLYHHYKDNCSTRIRDLVDVITGGDFSKWAKEQNGLTFRQETSRILHNNIVCNWVLDFLQGPSIDVPATLWDDMFLPSVLEDALVEYSKSNPVVGELSTLVEGNSNRPLDYQFPQSYLVQSLALGIILAALIYILRDRKKVLGWILGASNLVLGILGCILFFMMFFTSHDVTWHNENIVFINPLFIAAFVLCFGIKKHHKVLKWFYLVESIAVAVLILLKVFIPSVFFQDNLAQILTVLPMYLTAALAL